MHGCCSYRESMTFDINDVMAMIAEYDSESRSHITWQLLVNSCCDLQSRRQASAQGLSLQCLQSELTLV